MGYRDEQNAQSDPCPLCATRRIYKCWRDFRDFKFHWIKW